MIYNTSNPVELYPNTTWKLLPNNKFLKTGSTPLQQNGSNSIKIIKANLPAEKLQIDSFQLGKGTQNIIEKFYGLAYGVATGAGTSEAFSRYGSGGIGNAVDDGALNGFNFDASKIWTGYRQDKSI